MKYILLIVGFALGGCDYLEKSQKIEGVLAPNMISITGIPVEDVWQKVYETNSHEVWVDSTNHIVAFMKNGYAELVFSDIEGVQFVDHFHGAEHLLTSQSGDSKRLIVHKKDADGNDWWYVDQEFDGLPDLKLSPAKKSWNDTVKFKITEVPIEKGTSSNKSMQPTANASAD